MPASDPADPWKSVLRAFAPLCVAGMLVLLHANSVAQMSPEPQAHLANADDVQAVAAGSAVYGRYCASCHGKKLQGQPLWQVEDEYSARRAPAHDESGHTWQHSDEELFRKIDSGRFEFESADEVSYMPAYSEALGATEILQVIAFIKSRWPLGLRVSQAMLNPGYAGMPRNADTVEWTLPPNCRTITAKWRSESR